MTNTDDFDGFNECWLRHETHLGKMKTVYKTP